MTDLTKIQSNLVKLSKVMFGSSSPVENFFQVKFTPIKMRQRKVSQRIRVDSDALSPNVPRSGSHSERVDSESGDKHGSDDESGERKKKTSLGDFIPRVSVFKGKSGKKQKGKITFADEDNDDNDATQGRNFLKREIWVARNRVIAFVEKS